MSLETKEDELSLTRTLASYVPRLVVRRLYNTQTKIKPPEMESYPACVMFADLSGFTPLTEKMSKMGLEGVEKLTTELNKYFDKLIGIIHRHGGDIVKVGAAVAIDNTLHSLQEMQCWLYGQQDLDLDSLG